MGRRACQSDGGDPDRPRREHHGWLGRRQQRHLHRHEQHPRERLQGGVTHPSGAPSLRRAGHSSPSFRKMATRTIANGGGNWNANLTWVENAVPTSSDDVVATATSGQLTINVAAACRSINLTGYTNTLTHAAGVTLSVGTTTAGPSNVALLFLASGWTYTLGSQTTSAISFVSTSATQLSVTFAGKTTGNLTFNGSGGSWTCDAINGGTSATLTLTAGTYVFAAVTITGGLTITLGTATFNGAVSCTTIAHTAGTTVFNAAVSATSYTSANSNTRAITFASTLTLSGTGTVWDTSTVTGLTVTASACVVSMTDTSASAKTFSDAASHTFAGVTVSGGSGQVIFTTPAGSTVNNFTINAPASIKLTSAQTITVQQFNAWGSRGNVVTIVASTGASAATVANTTGVTVCDYLALTDFKATGCSFYAGPNSNLVSGNTVTAGPYSGDYLRVGNAQAGGAASITLDANASATTNFYQYGSVSLIGGTGAGH